MNNNMEFVISIATLIIGSGGLLGVVYSLVNASKKKPRIIFNETGHGYKEMEKDNLLQIKFWFSGQLENFSTEDNSISQLIMICWNEKKTEFIWRGSGAEILDEQGKKIGPPLKLSGKDGKKCEIIYCVPKDNVWNLINQTKPLLNSRLLSFPRFEWDIILQDSYSNSFLKKGKLINYSRMKIMDETRLDLFNANMYGWSRLKHLWRFYVLSFLYELWYKFKLIFYYLGWSAGTQ